MVTGKETSKKTISKNNLFRGRFKDEPFHP
jgi:hypothetical protein